MKVRDEDLELDEYKLRLNSYEGVHGCDGCCVPPRFTE
jgi:hypothetical protein